jgi:hypothetical protein
MFVVDVVEVAPGIELVLTWCRAEGLRYRWWIGAWGAAGWQTAPEA